MAHWAVSPRCSPRGWGWRTAEVGGLFEIRDAGCGMQGGKMVWGWRGMRDAGCGMRDAGWGMRDTRCGMRDTRCGMRDTGCGMGGGEGMEVGLRLAGDARCGMGDTRCGMGGGEMVCGLLEEGCSLRLVANRTRSRLRARTRSRTRSRIPLYRVRERVPLRWVRVPCWDELGLDIGRGRRPRLQKARRIVGIELARSVGLIVFYMISARRADATTGRSGGI